MKKILLLVNALFMFQIQSYSQNGVACNDFTDDTGLSESDPNDKVTYSVANGELTINFTDALFWDDNEVKWEFPSTIDISGSVTANISYEIAVESVSINGGTGGGCAAIDYISLGMGFFDGIGPYSDGTATVGYVEGGFQNGSIDATIDPAIATTIAGIFIKPAFFIDDAGTPDDPGDDCNTNFFESGSGTITATIKIKNLKVGNVNCDGTSTAVKPVHQLISESKIYPNPSSDQVTLSLELTSASYVKVTITDLMGKEVKTVAEGIYSQVTKEVVTSDLKAGTYIVSYKIGGAIEKTQLLMVR